jgi:hypothetical protein
VAPTAPIRAYPSWVLAVSSFGLRRELVEGTEAGE